MLSTNFRPAVNLHEWDAELDRQRGARPIPVDVSLLEKLRQTSRRLQADLEVHRQSSWIDRSEYRALQDVSNNAASLLTRVQSELACYDVADAQVTPLPTLERYLLDGVLLAEDVDAQRAEILQALAIVSQLRPVIDALLQDGEFPAARLQPVLDLLLAAPASTVQVPQVFSPGLSLERVLEAEGTPLPWFYVPAVMRARWLSGLQPLWQTQLIYPRETLVIAALLADVGQLVISWTSLRARFKAVSPTIPEYPRHPEISAALLAGVTDGSPLWAILAGQHHERLDGSGFPRKLRGTELLPAARILTVIVRWTELLQSVAISGGTEIIASAATALWRETHQGEFDSEIVTQLLTAIHPELPNAARKAVLHGTRLTLDPAQPLAGPHQVAEYPARVIAPIAPPAALIASPPAVPQPVPVAETAPRKPLKKNVPPTRTPKPRLASLGK